MLQSELKELEYMEKCDSNVLVAELIDNQRKIKANYELYYDKKQDLSWINHYYCNISTNPRDLFQEYHDLITNTHKYKHRYSISKDQYLYKWVDLQPNGQLKSVYSGKDQNPHTLIKEDFKTVQKRFESYRKLIKIQRFSDKSILDHVKRISNQHKFNAEHVVPQSWFRAREPMKGDLHHLFACEPRCNSLRSNFPYYEYDKEEFPLNYRSDCGQLKINRFEPSYGKGVVARATLYFLLRYPNKITRKFQKKIEISLLTHWHNKYQVTEYERHRNKAIFEIQGNRNPFIDFPDLTAKISF